MAIEITYDLQGFSFTSGTQGDRWRRPWSATGINAPDIPTAIRDLYLALPNPGTPAPAPLLASTTLRDTEITDIWCLTDDQGVPTGNGQARGVEYYSSPIDARSEPPPAGDTGSGVTTSGRGYIEQQQLRRGRKVGTDNTGFQYTNVLFSDGLYYTSDYRAPFFGSAFSFSRNEQTNPRIRLDSLRGTLNAAIWNGYAVDTVCMVDASFDSVNGGQYYAVRYDFVYKASGWAIPVTGRDWEKNRKITDPAGDEEIPFIPLAQADWSSLGIVL